MIKNFIVKVKQVKYKDKGIINLLNYLTNEKKHPDGIINYDYFNKDDFLTKCIMNIEEKNLQNKLNKKGGRPIQSYGDSFIFSLPKNTKATNKELEEIIKLILKKSHTFLKKDFPELDLKTFTKSLFVNVHTNNHIHINIVFPKVFKTKNNKLLTNIQTNKKSFVSFTKTLFNQVLNEVIGLDYKTYKPNTKFKRGYKSIYNKEEIEKVNKLTETMLLQRKEIQKIYEETLKDLKESEKITKAFTLSVRYLKNYKKEEKQKNLTKSQSELLKLKKQLKIIKESEDYKTNKQVKEYVEEFENMLNL